MQSLALSVLLSTFCLADHCASYVDVSPSNQSDTKTILNWLLIGFLLLWLQYSTLTMELEMSKMHIEHFGWNYSLALLLTLFTFDRQKLEKKINLDF